MTLASNKTYIIRISKPKRVGKDRKLTELQIKYQLRS